MDEILNIYYNKNNVVYPSTSSQIIITWKISEILGTKIVKFQQDKIISIQSEKMFNDFSPYLIYYEFLTWLKKFYRELFWFNKIHQSKYLNIYPLHHSISLTFEDKVEIKILDENIKFHTEEKDTPLKDYQDLPNIIFSIIADLFNLQSDILVDGKVIHIFPYQKYSNEANTLNP